MHRNVTVIFVMTASGWEHVGNSLGALSSKYLIVKLKDTAIVRFENTYI